MPRRNLSLLLPKLPAYDGQLNPDPIITGITADHRAVAPGNLYAAIPNFDLGGMAPIDGTPYIDDAIAMGATAILAPTGTVLPSRSDIAFVTVDRPDYVLSQIAARFYAQQPRVMAAVTGTNGKTSTAQFVRQLWAMAGYKAASLGTLGLIAPHITQPPFMTTPHCIALHRDLAMLAENSVTHGVMEASSHGLHQYRMHGVKLAVAGFTNLTRDHLNYHGTLENYRDAKLRLFTEILPYNAPAVLNADAPGYQDFFDVVQRVCTQVVTFGTTGHDLKIINVKTHERGQLLHLHAWGTDYTVDLPLVGYFQVENALCAAAMVIAAGEPASTVIANLANLAPVRGRIELAGYKENGAAVYVDYAHTAEGLETVLRTVRPYTRRQLHVLFGMGGGGDPAGRPRMGHIAAAYADRVIVTDDNARLEDPKKIRADIMAGVPTGIEIADRVTAIQAAIDALQDGDVLVLAGKGHETTQNIGGVILPCDDLEIARFALRHSANTTKKSGAI